MEHSPIRVLKNQNIFIEVKPDYDVSVMDDPDAIETASWVDEKIINRVIEVLDDEDRLTRVANQINAISDVFIAQLITNSSVSENSKKRGRLSELTVEFGLDLKGEIDAVIVGAEATAQFKISLKIEL